MQQRRSTPSSTSKPNQPSARMHSGMQTRSARSLGARTQPTAETEDAMRVVGENLASFIAEAEAEAERQRLEAEQRRQQEAEEAEAAAARAELAESEEAGESEEADPESDDPEALMAELFAQLEAAEARATHAEQQAIYAGQQAAQAAEHLMHTGAAVVADNDADEPARGSSLARWAGWTVAVLAVGVAVAGYFTGYRPLQQQLIAQTNLTESQARRSSETEAALRRSFDEERDALNDQLTAARAAAAAAPAPAEADAADADSAAADSADSAASDKASKAEARAAKREAWLAKKAERAAKREARAAARKSKSGSDDDDAPKHKAKPAASTSEDIGSDDPLEGLD